MKTVNEYLISLLGAPNWLVYDYFAQPMGDAVGVSLSHPNKFVFLFL